MTGNPIFFPSSRALVNYDILLTIFDGNYYRDKGVLSALDLKNCALVCRGFSEPALRVLWKTISPPEPLWRLLVPKGCIEDIISEELYKVPERWDRFQWYARFVRELEVPDHGWSTVRDAQIFRCLLNFNGRASFTPSLQALSYSPESIWDESFCALFTPRLRDITIHYAHPSRFDHRNWISNRQSIDNVPYEEPIHRLRKSSPHLESLRLFSIGITPNLLGTITSFKHLREARVSAIDSSAFRNLVAMPTLTELGVHSLQWTEQTPCEAIRADSLRGLAVGDDASILTRFFQALKAPKLESATLHLFRDDPDAFLDYVPCLTALARAAEPTIFHTFTLEVGYRRGPVPELPLVELLAPLFQLRGLKHLELGGTRLPLFVDDQDFMYLALAWPKLEMFSLSPMSQNLNDICQVPTPVVLDHFRLFCPDLRRLRLPYLDLRGIEFTVVPPPRDRARHGLVSLTIGSVHRSAYEERDEPSAEHIDDMARFLLRLFPALDFSELEQLCQIDWPCGLGDVLAASTSEPAWRKVYDRCRIMKRA